MTIFPESEARRVRAALANLPYSGTLQQPLVENVTDLCQWLATYATTVAAVVVQTDREAAELRRLKADRDAIRRFLGTW